MGKILMLLGFAVVAIGVVGDYGIKFITSDEMRLWFYLGGVALLLFGLIGNKLSNARV